MIESFKQQKADTNKNFPNSNFFFDRCSRDQVEVREIKNMIIRSLCLILSKEKCVQGINCSKQMVYHLQLLKIFSFLEKNPAKVGFNYVFRKIQSKSKYYQIFQQSETFKSLATFHFSKLSTPPSEVKSIVMSNHSLTNSIKLVQLYNSPVSFIQCLGCIGKFYENFPYCLQKAQQNYIILDIECLKQSNMMKSAVCAALNNSRAYIIITKRFLKTDYCYKVQGLQNIGEVEQKIRSLISQSLLYMIPNSKKIEQRIQKIPFYKQKSNKYQNLFVLRITLLSLQNKHVYINLKKDTNSEKEWNVSTYTLLKYNQMLEINGPHVYNFILNRYYYTKKFSSANGSKHNGIKCYAADLHEQKKNAQEVDKYEKKGDNNSSKGKETSQSKVEDKQAKQAKQADTKRLEQLIELGPYKHHTIMTISKSKNSNTLTQIKSILTEAKIQFQVKQIVLSWMAKKTPMVYMLSHTCPSQLMNKLLFSCNKSGNLSFHKPGKYITVRDSAFFAANREEEFKKAFYSIILLDGPEKAYKRSFEMSNMDDGSYNKHVEGPVNYAFKKAEDAILAFCWFLAQDVRKLEFRKP